MSEDNIQEFDLLVNAADQILWQYNEADNLRQLIIRKNTWYFVNHSRFWLDWYINIFSLKTANQFGCLVWSRILDFPVNISADPPPANENLGFEEFRKNFNHGNFENPNEVYSISLETARVILRLRYYQLSIYPSSPNLNRMIKDVFEDYGQGYVSDGLDMSIQYNFQFVVPDDMKDIFDNSDILPSPAGVAVSYVSM